MSEPKVYMKQSIRVMLEPGKYAFCTCGESAGQPFCDGSHKGTEFSPKIFSIEAPQEAYLCLCKHSKNIPFCDGTHKRI